MWSQAPHFIGSWPFSCNHFSKLFSKRGTLNILYIPFYWFIFYIYHYVGGAKNFGLGEKERRRVRDELVIASMRFGVVVGGWVRDELGRNHFLKSFCTRTCVLVLWWVGWHHFYVPFYLLRRINWDEFRLNLHRRGKIKAKLWFATNIRDERNQTGGKKRTQILGKNWIISLLIILLNNRCLILFSFFFFLASFQGSVL